MVDVGDKPVTRREAIAEAQVTTRPEVIQMIANGAMPKGDVAAVARIAGIQAAKKTSDLVPLCHPLAIDAVEVDVALEESSVYISATVRTTGKTGVEMEALTAVSVAALAVYDMCKAVDRAMTIEYVRLQRKTGGKSGEFVRGDV